MAERVLSKRYRFRTETPTVAIKKNGRIILNRVAASFFEATGYKKVILTWNDETMRLSIKGVKNHAEEHLLYFGGQKNIPAAFSAKTALTTIGYDFSQNRTFQAALRPEHSAVEVILPPACFREGAHVAAPEMHPDTVRP